ncbi:MAG: hypothetical protein GC154_11705 [bacterium]|nr:hypothetical protein [bacterium]
MFEWLNTHKKSIMTYTLWLVIPSFVLLYGYGQCSAPQRQTWVAKVNGEKISETQWRRTQDNMRDRMRQSNPDAEIDPDQIRDQALESVIVSTLLSQLADQWGVGVTDQEVVQSIRNIQAFQDDNGNFNTIAYQNILYSAGLTPVGFEALQREEMVRQKVRDIVAHSAFRASGDSKSELKKLKLDVELLSFEPSSYTDQVEVDEDGLKAFFEANIEDYRVPDQRRIAYVDFAAADYIQKATYTDAQVERYFNQNAQQYQVPPKARVQYISYMPDQFSDQAEVANEEIQEYYDSNKTKYVTQNRVKFDYVVQPLQALADVQEVTPEAIKQYYEDNISRYEHGEQAKASHILLRVTPGADEEAVKQKALDIKKEIEGGLSFANAAMTYSEDPSAVRNKGDLGYFSKGQMVPPFEEAAFSLPLGQVSDPVKTQFGYHLILVEDRKEAGTDPLEDVEKDIGDMLRKQRAVSAMEALAGSIQSLSGVSDRYEIKTTGWVTRGDEIPGVPSTDGYYLTSAAFRSNETTPVVMAGNVRTENLYLVQTVEREESRPKSLLEAHDEIVRDLKNEKATQIAKDAAQADMARIRDASETLEAVAASRGTEVETSQPFSRQDTFVPPFGARPFQLMSAALNNEEGSVQGPFTTPSGTFIIRVLAKEPARLPELDEVRAQVVNDYLQADAARQARIEAIDFVDSLDRNGKTIAEGAKERGLKVEETDFFGASEPIPGLGYKPDLNRAAFDLDRIGEHNYKAIPDQEQNRNNPQAAPTVNGFFSIELLEKRATYLPTLEEAREDVERDYKLHKAEAIAQSEAENMLKEVQAKIASSQPVSATQTVELSQFAPSDGNETKAVYRGPITISGDVQVPGVGRAPVIVKTAMDLKPGQVSQVAVNYNYKEKDGKLVRGAMTGAYIIQLLGREDLDEPQASPFDRFIEQRQQIVAASSWIDEVSAAATIEYNETLLSPYKKDESMAADAVESASAS